LISFKHTLCACKDNAYDSRTLKCCLVLNGLYFLFYFLHACDYINFKIKWNWVIIIFVDAFSWREIIYIHKFIILILVSKYKKWKIRIHYNKLKLQATISYYPIKSKNNNHMQYLWCITGVYKYDKIMYFIYIIPNW